jgi:2-polyprenyl-3-methyl-5-hydroxy-6-metoxy-1,4-benzoquinol methylase
MMTTQPAIDEGKLHAFMGKLVGDLSGAMTSALCHLGDRLGLFKDLASNGPATSAELAQRAGITERYAREWLGGMGAAGYLDYDPASQRYTLPAEHAPALAQEGGPMFIGGMLQMLPAQLGHLDQLAEAFRNGGGVPQSAYGEGFWDGFERFSGTWFENFLLQQWLPAVPDVQAKLERGASVADVGCGRGRALLKMAQAFPASRFMGFDAYAPTIELATQRARAVGVGDRVRFEVRDVVQGIPEQYDLITTFDVIHDMANPRGALKAIRQALKPDGSYLCLEINAADRREDNAGPLAALFYGASITYCMTTSLANNGEGLGTLGMPEGKVREFCAEAGFGSVRRLPLDNPFNCLYEAKP